MLAAAGRGLSIKGSCSDIEASMAASFLMSQGDHPETESEELSALPGQYQTLEEMMQQVKKLKAEVAELKRPRESSRASFAPELYSSGAFNPFADVGNASNSYNDLLLGTQKQAKELEELKCQWAARSRCAPAVVALQDL
eukprot:3928087-Rhodomonas_salina.1